jgi:hypothetical protein
VGKRTHGGKHVKAKTSATVGVMYPSEKENVLVIKDQKFIKVINKLGLIGMSYFEAWIASLIPSLFHLLSLV